MLGPPGTVTTGWVRPSGRPSTTKDGLSRTTHRTLLLVPFGRRPPATSWVANTCATASPGVPSAHGTGHGVPFVCVNPPCAHAGGSESLRTVPEQPPAN